MIVVPISALVYKISLKIGKDSKLDKILNRPNILLYLSLIFAVIMFYFVDSKAFSLINTNAEILRNQPVEVIYNKSANVIEGVPETVDITLIGRSSDLYLARQLSTHDVTIDLSGLKPGTHKVNLNYRESLSSIDYKLDPSVATVIIYPKKSNTKTVTIDLLNDDKLDEKLFIQEIKNDTDQVYIKGAEHVLSKVATVKALLDVNNIPNPGVGDIKMNSYLT